MKTYSKVLTIAGSDSGGGAGIQADIKAISATGSYAASVITAVTAQNTVGVKAVHTVPSDIVSQQIDAVLQDIGADAIKIGMLSSAEVIRTVKRSLFANDYLPNGVLVLDPVMVATSGDRLLDEDAQDVLSTELAPYATIITPNIPEAEILCGKTINSEDELPGVGKLLSNKLYAISGKKVSVLMKGGHFNGRMSADYLYDAHNDSVLELPAIRFKTVNTHGTGCTLSSALASYLAQGLNLQNAAIEAKKYITGAIEYGSDYIIGHGHGPVNHFWNLNNK